MTTIPPLSSSVFPFSRSVIVMIASCVSKPLMVFRSPVFFTSKSTSICLSSADGCSGAASGSFFACSSARFIASSICCRSSANVVTL